MEDLQIVELVVRKDPKVIEQCGIIGIPPEDMHKVYCDRMQSPSQSFLQRITNSIYSLDNRL
jgi:Cu2+-containing amine oxidase